MIKIMLDVQRKLFLASLLGMAAAAGCTTEGVESGPKTPSLSPLFTSFAAPESVDSFDVAQGGRYVLWRSRYPGPGWPTPKGPFFQDNQSGKVSRMADLLEACGASVDLFNRSAFSPDGTMLLVGGYRKQVVYVPELAKAVTVADETTGSIYAHWEGRRVALYQHWEQPAQQIELVDPPSGTRQTISAWGWIMAASDDGRRILIMGGTGSLSERMPTSEFRAKARLMVIDDQGKEVRNLSLKLNETTPYAAMSPDGRVCAYQVREDALWPGGIKVAAVAGGQPSRRVAEGMFPVALDNNGSLVAFSGSRLSLVRPSGESVDISTDFLHYAVAGNRIYHVRKGQAAADSVTFP